MCSWTRPLRLGGTVLIPIESAMRTRRLVRTASHVGKIRSGLHPTFSSSSPRQAASGGGKAVKLFPEISSANRECEIGGNAVIRNPGRYVGVADCPKRRWVVSSYVQEPRRTRNFLISDKGEGKKHLSNRY